MVQAIAEIVAFELEEMKKCHPHAKVLVHPESPSAVIKLADVVGSTTQLIKAAQTLSADEFIVATDGGILHKMKLLAPGKQFIEAPTSGDSATCKSCAHCPWMAMNGLANLVDVLESGANEVHVEPEIGRRAKRSIQRMLDFAQGMNLTAVPSGSLEKNQALFKGIGPA